MSDNNASSIRVALTAPVLVGALGYFVDIFDLLIFPVTSMPSLTELGVTDARQMRLLREAILNWQMIGMLVGGIFWGVLGDKIGRRTALSWSILLMTGATFCIALLPGYAAIGVAAPLMLLAPSGFFLLGGLVWALRSVLPEQAEDPELLPPDRPEDIA